MICRRTDPSALTAVRHVNGKCYHVLTADLIEGRRYLNTYSRNGVLIVQRGHTYPVDRESIR